MDYIFFAVNSLAAGLSVLLLVYDRTSKVRRPLRGRHYLFALAAAAIFYSMESVLALRLPLAYYLANLLPVPILIVILVLVLGRDQAVRS